VKRYLTKAIPVLGVLVLAIATPQAQAGSCSLAALAGRWTYTYTGTIFTPNGPVPLASVGRFRQDAAGNIQGTQTRSVGGSSGVEDISGVISINKYDCSATGTIDVLVDGQVQRTATLALAYDQDDNHMRAIFVSLTLVDGTNLPVVITVDGNRVNTKD